MKYLLGNLGCRFFSFITLRISCHSLLAHRVSVLRWAVILMGIPLYVICCFSFAVFHIFSLCLMFVSLINMYLGVLYLGFILYGTIFASCTWVVTSSPILRKFLTIISSNIFSCHFLLSSSSGTSMIWMLESLTLSQMSKSVRISFYSFLFFFFFTLCFIYFHHSILYLNYTFFCLICTVWISMKSLLGKASLLQMLFCNICSIGSLQRVLISVIALFIIDCLSFINVPWGQEVHYGQKFWSRASCFWVSVPLLQ